MQVEKNPLIALDNEELYDIFHRMLAHRYRTDILIEYYKLKDLPMRFSWWGEQIGPIEKAAKELEFLKCCSNGNIDELEDTVADFWKRLRPQGNHLRDHLIVEDRYNEIAIAASDLRLIKPLFYLYPDFQALDIADIGAGKNRLGAEILGTFKGDNGKASYFNWIDNLGEKREVNVVGTDVSDWHEDKPIQGLGYRLQPSPTRIPIDPESRDIIITKWCFHHMNPQQMRRQIRNIFKILRPGGSVIVIEAFSSKLDALPQEAAFSDIPEPTFSQRLLDISRRIEFADIWPDGPWKSECYEISTRYLALNWEEQHALLALEDFIGHYVLNQREYMPFPFSYLPAETIIEEFSNLGFEEQRWNFQLFGFAPVIRRGPPTARFIFKKPAP